LATTAVSGRNLAALAARYHPSPHHVSGCAAQSHRLEISAIRDANPDSMCQTRQIQTHGENRPDFSHCIGSAGAKCPTARGVYTQRQIPKGKGQDSRIFNRDVLELFLPHEMQKIHLSEAPEGVHIDGFEAAVW
jgi:hypothetical protein